MTAFSFSSGDPTHLTSGNPAVMADLSGSFADVKARLNSSGLFDENDLTATMVQKLGLSNAGTTGRGASIIATTESRTNVAYGTLTTPDQVSVALPTNGLIVVAYQATWQQSAGTAARAAIFVGATQLKQASSTSPILQETSMGPSTGADYSLATTTVGLISDASSPVYTGDVTTGQLVGSSGVGGPCFIFAAAGTYAVSVQFKSTSGSVTAKNRKLWVWTIGF